MKDILINLLFIIVVLLVTQLTLQWHRMSLQDKMTKLLIYFAAAVLIFLCMTFSIPVNGQYIYDLRPIPYILGSLFGGPIVSISLYLTILIYRVFIGVDAGFIGAVINYGLLLIPLAILSKRYIKSALHIKLLCAGIVTALHIYISHVTYTHIFYSGLPTDIFIQANLIKTITILSVVIIADAINRFYKMRIQLDSLEKMELVYHLSASISHEVRNGLTSAHGFLYLLKEKETDNEKREYLRIALDELKRTETIIRDFLTFAKPTPKQLKEVEVDQLVKNTIILIEPLAKMNSIEIKKTLDPAKVIGDEGMLQQSLINIFKNAIEAMPHGGTITIAVRSTAEQAIISVKDTGVGMSPDQIQRIGTPYFTTKGQQGTGLGMMVAYRVIHELNGKIEIDSTIGKGTEFRIVLPL